MYSCCAHETVGGDHVDEFARAITNIHPGPAPDALSATHAGKPPTLLRDGGFRFWMIPDRLLGVMGRTRLGRYYVSAYDRKYHKLYNWYESSPRTCHALAPALFDDDDQGYGTVIADVTVPPERADAARKAAANCAEGATWMADW